MIEPIQLKGGRVTSGVVRINDTVARPTGSHSPFVHQVLLHLEKAGFSGSPRFLGYDDLGREILTYIDGYVPFELGWWNDDQILQVAHLIRTFHDASKSFPGCPKDKVVCHNDLSPCNTVFLHNFPYAFIDFDAASFDSPIADVCYAMWLWLDLGNEDISASEQVRRAKIFCDAYKINWRSVQDALPQRINQSLSNYQQKTESDASWHEAAKWAHQCLKWIELNIS